MKNKNRSWIYLSAIRAANPENYLSFEEINDFDLEEDLVFVDMTPYSSATPEQILLKKERWMSLREEAKQIIELLVDCPREVFVEIIGTRKRNFGAREKHVRRYLKRLWGKEEEFVIDSILYEIHDFLRNGVEEETRG